VRIRSTFASLVLLLSTACSSPQVAPRDTSEAGGITVVGWSVKQQAPVAVRGVVRGESGAVVGEFDTRPDPVAGKTIDRLPAGTYRIEVTERFGSSGFVPAQGAQKISLEPGERARREVAVEDRDSDGSARPTDSERRR